MGQVNATSGELSGFGELSSRMKMTNQENTHFMCVLFPCLRVSVNLVTQTQMGWDAGTGMGAQCPRLQLPSPAPSWTFHIQIHIWMLWQGPSFSDI